MTCLGPQHSKVRGLCGTYFAIRKVLSTVRTLSSFCKHDFHGFLSTNQVGALREGLAVQIRVVRSSAKLQETVGSQSRLQIPRRVAVGPNRHHGSRRQRKESREIVYRVRGRLDQPVGCQQPQLNTNSEGSPAQSGALEPGRPHSQFFLWPEFQEISSGLPSLEREMVSCSRRRAPLPPQPDLRLDSGLT
jgi:hypothetical protein